MSALLFLLAWLAAVLIVARAMGINHLDDGDNHE